MNDVATHHIEVPGHRLVHPIGTSGVATVYLAVQQASESQVVVKVFETTDETAVARFEQALRTNARLAHPNIVAMPHIGRTPDGHLFHSMPLLLSSELAAPTLHDKPLTVAALLRGVLEALAHAHQRGIAHAGIKPSNVLVDERGHAQVADFGIARCAAELELPRHEATGYLSPEQVRGKPAGRRSDLYGVGVLAYYLLAGSLPFERNAAAATSDAHKRPPVPHLPPTLGAWQPWIDKALAESPDSRFQSAQAMADALSAVDGQPPSANVPPRAPRTHAPAWLISAALAIVIAAAALAGWAFWSQRRAALAPAHGHGAPSTHTDPIGSTIATAAQPAVPATTGDVGVTTERVVSSMLAEAGELRAHGRLLAPRDHNAVRQYLAVLALDPGNRLATAGLDAALATVGKQLGSAWHDHHPTQAIAALKHGDRLAQHASERARRAWATQRKALAGQVGDAVAAAAHAHQPQRIDALKPLAEALPATLPDGLDLATAARMASTPVAGMHLRDRGGPVLVYAPASAHAPAFAIARVEVTRAEYAAFVHATHRPDSTCLEAYNPFSRLRRLTWQKPGFAQGRDYPVVCVSWDDAVAYARWLSRVTGEPYGLPSNSEWLRAAQGVPKGTPCQLGNVDDISRTSVIDNDRWSCDDGHAQTAPVGHYRPSGIGAYDMYGNVSEWIAGGSPGSRMFRGLSWRDGSHRTPLGSHGTADSDVGYTSVGFRVVRVIDAAHPAPAAIARR